MQNDLTKLKILPDFLRNSAKKFPRKVALIFENTSYSYREIDEKSEAVSSFLIAQTQKGDVVAMLQPNTPDFIFAYFGILKAGCIALLLPHNISDTSFEYQIEKTRPKFLIVADNLKAKATRLETKEQFKVIDLRTLLATKQRLKRKVAENDVSTIIFTSGTTSAPKGVTLKHKNVVNATKNIIEFLKWSKEDRDVNISALSHSFGLGHVHCIFAVSGTTILFRDAINLKKIIQTIKEKNATTFGAVPAILRLITTHFLEEFKKNASHLRCIHTDTSLLEPELIQSFLTNLPKTDFSYYYGLSEASRSTFITFNKHPDKLLSVGAATPGVQIAIMDAQDKKLPAGESGEICIKGKHVIESYWENPKASERIRKGYLHTGDVGYLDDDGFLYFTGRTDDVINVSGEKVSPDEIEMHARTIEGIIDACAIGVEDRLLGQVVKLFIVTNNVKIEITMIQTELRKRLESYKVPRHIEIIDAIPKTENGKLIRSKLKQTYKSYDK